MSVFSIDWLRSQIGVEASQVSPSPFGRWLNGVIEKVEEGSVMMRYEVRKDMTNPAGILHGGVVAGIMDDLMGLTAAGTLGLENFYTTVNLSIDFLASGKVNDTLFATAHIIRKGKQIIHAECVVRNQEDKLLAKCTTNLVITPILMKS